MTAQLTMSQKAHAAWGPALPDWVGALADTAQELGLNACAGKIGYSAAVISQTIGNKYPGDIANVEEKVRIALMGLTVTCPALGVIGRDQCLDWQAKPWASTNSTRSRVYRACRAGCPHSRLPASQQKGRKHA
ncbi:transcriptional regulator [Roseibium sp.]|uniref:transcriptional regulator n=1 Tax=Roseibium sp. TaxID=1936156 RepID=UPI003A987274